MGANGIGKTTLLKSLLGIIQPLEGEVETGDFIDLGYFEQEAEGSRQTPLEAVWDAFPALNQAEVRAALAKCGLTSKHIESQIQVLSGGEQAKVRFCLLMNRENNVLVLDEPTNHLDIDSKEVLENALIDFDGTLLFVSHDRYFINRVATKVMEISEDGAAIYLGDYDYYLEKKAELEELARLEAEENQVSEEVQVASAGASDYQAQKANQKEMRKLSRRIEQIENELETIEERLEEISAAMLKQMMWQNCLTCKKSSMTYQFLKRL